MTPIYKRGSKGDPANYRPVCLTPVCCKVMESITRDNIVDHLTKYHLIRSAQHGFVNIYILKQSAFFGGYPNIKGPKLFGV